MGAPFHVVLLQTEYTSIEDAPRAALAEHVARSKQWHAEGRLVMAGAFLDRPGEPLQTMAVTRTREDAEEYASGDPFVVAGSARVETIRPWADILGLPGFGGAAVREWSTLAWGQRSGMTPDAVPERQRESHQCEFPAAPQDGDTWTFAE
jgi:uncharacterized protein